MADAKVEIRFGNIIKITIPGMAATLKRVSVLGFLKTFFSFSVDITFPETLSLLKLLKNYFFAFFQSSKKAFKPLSVKGWLAKLFKTLYGIVAISAPISAASRT